MNKLSIDLLVLGIFCRKLTYQFYSDVYCVQNSKSIRKLTVPLMADPLMKKRIKIIIHFLRKYLTCLSIRQNHICINGIQYIPRNMHTVFALLCFVVVIHWLIFPYPSGLLHWHCGNLTIAPVPAKQPWWIWINTSCEFITHDCITTTKQSTTKPCAYFLGYNVSAVRCFNRKNTVTINRLPSAWLMVLWNPWWILQQLH